MKAAPSHTSTSRVYQSEHRKGFTLVELLVVISIIALLASIMLPSLSKAREMAKAAQCLSNLHNVGLGLATYSAEQSYFPSAYSYIDGASSAGGYNHWTASLSPSEYTAPPTPAGQISKYPKMDKQFVCPSHDAGGWAPSNFTPYRIPNPPAGQVAQSATLDDRQAPRLSYVANEILMPRKKYSPANDTLNTLRLVSPDKVDSANNTILLAEFSNSANCIYGSSSGGGAAYKSHRPTNGVKIQGGGVFDGEKYATGTQVFKLTLQEAQDAIKAVLADQSAAASNHHISYIEPAMHNGYSNYAFADGHAEKFTLKETLDPGAYMWGRRVYSCVDKPEIQDNPVTVVP